MKIVKKIINKDLYMKHKKSYIIKNILEKKSLKHINIYDLEFSEYDQKSLEQLGILSVQDLINSPKSLDNRLINNS